MSLWATFPLSLHLGGPSSRGPVSLWYPPQICCSLADTAIQSCFDVVVVGGGASGVFGAIAAARSGASVLCLESGTQMLRKVKVSGGGRCNVMHDHRTWDEQDGRNLLRSRYPRGASELVGPLTARFSPPSTAAWFEAEGVTLIAEADGRVFPSTNRSQTIVDTLLQAARSSGVTMQTASRVVSAFAVSKCGAGFVVCYERRAEKEMKGAKERHSVRCGSLLLATGSSSYELAQELGHTISPLLPSLFSFRLCKGGMIDGSLAGIATTAELLWETEVSTGTKKRRRKKATTSNGPLLITHRGLSGPCALKMSAFAAEELATAGYKGTLYLNLAPHLKPGEVAAQLVDFKTRRDTRLKQVGSFNPFQLPRRLWLAVVHGRPPSDNTNNVPAVERRADRVDPAKQWQELSTADLRVIEGRVCRAPLEFSGKDSNKDEFVTCGGVSWKGVDSRSMESKHVPGLFFAGELLDVDGITGGHNFQAAWTTGYISGMAAAQSAMCKA
mmetsp:Transcript_40196/g.66719  ORF Transcript_40196/g.66719 Transcript_40196/m.66719 type:complete len:500 (-) Transcript_40196:80-1579(-)|eukprot:CAMPEP_0119324840 /NCGR_PEP_ID=MMETSP1333-20130426/64319_1 /TAXON_ID=418940 /ORGANISM="Scyphosphaera apsteinii, Strain RCC1455" /LENGTH=499 /DNA_ID=CAMNT_0007332645 /DNA_START=186 /DNA_END=1685 /DNA_ORIENTATION=+